MTAPESKAAPSGKGAVAIADYRKAYARLHDFVSDMIEGGRLTAGMIPDDYAAVVEALEDAARAEHLAKPFLDTATGAQP